MGGLRGFVGAVTVGVLAVVGGGCSIMPTSDRRSAKFIAAGTRTIRNVCLGVDCVALKVIRDQVQMFDDAANSQLDGRLVEGLPA
jgi:hypothetical protein